MRLYFSGKPDDATRGRLKSRGFRWTPSLGCWQAYRNPTALDVARREAGVPVVEHGDQGSPPAAPCGCLAGAHEPAPEADPTLHACPDGDACRDAGCIAENDRRRLARAIDHANAS